ncbi:hypothetical protein Trydic_g20252 [Trypoxylus dichotomus]
MMSKTALLLCLLLSSSLVCHACLPGEFLLPPPLSTCEPYRNPGGSCLADLGSLSLLTLLLGNLIGPLLQALGLCAPNCNCIGGICRLIL